MSETGDIAITVVHPDHAPLLRSRLARGEPIVGFWSGIGGAETAELLASCGPDFVVADLQHGPVAEHELPGVLAAVRASGVAPLVRVRSSSFPDIGRPLDLGAEGVFVPNVRGVDHAAEVLSYCRYGPVGARSIGRLSGGSDNPLCFFVLETAQALDELDSILALEGLDGLYVGPHDLSLSLGKAGDDDQEEMSRIISSVLDRCIAARKPVGVHTNDGAGAARYRHAGATIVTAAMDRAVLRTSLSRELAIARS
jgi:4-hydroxy-2-oxoheptanedioate aldolase